MFLFKSSCRNTPLLTQILQKWTTWCQRWFLQWRNQYTKVLPTLQAEVWEQNALAGPWCFLIFLLIFYIPVCVFFSIAWGFFTCAQFFFTIFIYSVFLIHLHLGLFWQRHNYRWINVFIIESKINHSELSSQTLIKWS